MARRPCSLDTSAAVPLLMRSHPAHDAVVAALSGRIPHLTPHSQIETYSVLTRLPRDARVKPEDALQALTGSFGPVLAPREGADLEVLPRLAAAGVAGGAVYDALVALAAVDAGLPLLTRDVRALPTYAMLGASVELLA